MSSTLKEFKPGSRNIHAKEDYIHLCINLQNLLEVCWVPFTDHSWKVSAEEGMDIDQY